MPTKSDGPFRRIRIDPGTGISSVTLSRECSHLAVSVQEGLAHDPAVADPSARRHEPQIDEWGHIAPYLERNDGTVGGSLMLRDAPERITDPCPGAAPTVGYRVVPEFRPVPGQSHPDPGSR